MKVNRPGVVVRGGLRIWRRELVALPRVCLKRGEGQGWTPRTDYENSSILLVKSAAALAQQAAAGHSSAPRGHGFKRRRGGAGMLLPAQSLLLM